MPASYPTTFIIDAMRPLSLIPALLICVCLIQITAASSPSVRDYESIQAALDANPGKVVFVPSGEYSLTDKLRIRRDGSGLVGPGKLIQQNPNVPIIEIEGPADVELRDLILTRPEGKQDTECEAVLAIKTTNLVLQNLKIIDNRTRSGAIVLRSSSGARISDCLIRNYMRVSIDDRTGDENWGYAFNCTDGTGISIGSSQGTLVSQNQVIETIYRPTPEIKEKYKLGQWVKQNPVKGKLMAQKVWDGAYSDNWQQGSAIVVTSPEVSQLTRIVGNHVENAAQGIDLHCDQVIVANNVVVNSFIGMKAMHGSRNVLIANNQFVKNTLWAIGLMPGVSSHAGNTDGGSIITGNIISDFGLGDAAWMWGNNRAPLRFDHGQESTDPPLSDVVIQGNVISSNGSAQYSYAVIVEGEPNAPRGLRFANNLFPAGKEGICNNTKLEVGN